jgi:hypothetical protein
LVNDTKPNASSTADKKPDISSTKQRILKVTNLMVSCDITSLAVW